MAVIYGCAKWRLHFPASSTARCAHVTHFWPRKDEQQPVTESQAPSWTMSMRAIPYQWPSNKTGRAQKPECPVSNRQNSDVSHWYCGSLLWWMSLYPTNIPYKTFGKWVTHNKACDKHQLWRWWWKLWTLPLLPSEEHPTIRIKSRATQLKGHFPFPPLLHSLIQVTFIQ